MQTEARIEIYSLEKDLDKAKEMIDYNPDYSLEKGYNKYIEWYIERKEWFS